MLKMIKLIENKHKEQYLDKLIKNIECCENIKIECYDRWAVFNFKNANYFLTTKQNEHTKKINTILYKIPYKFYYFLKDDNLIIPGNYSKFLELLDLNNESIEEDEKNNIFNTLGLELHLTNCDCVIENIKKEKAYLWLNLDNFNI